MPYIKMTVKAGNDEYTYKYHTHRYAKKSERGKNIRPTTKEQKKINKRLAYRKRQWTISSNFERGDWYITLTYRKNERPEDNKAAAKILSDTLGKLRRKLKRKGIPLYYISSTERGTKGAVHHHLIIKNNFDIGMLIELWKLGRVDSVSVYTDSMAELGAYFTKDIEGGKHANKQAVKAKETIYGASRNLKKPKITKQVVKAKTFSDVPTNKKGYTIIHFYKNFQSEAGYLYQEYIQTKTEVQANAPFTCTDGRLLQKHQNPNRLRK